MPAEALERHSDLSSYKILKGQFKQKISPMVVDQHSFYVETDPAVKKFILKIYKMKKTKATKRTAIRAALSDPDPGFSI